MFYFHSLRSLMNVVEPAVREILHSTPASEKPTSLYFVAVKGALCRLHQMGGKVILNPLVAQYGSAGTGTGTGTGTSTATF